MLHRKLYSIYLTEVVLAAIVLLLPLEIKSQVVTVPFDPNSLAAPHLAYNGRPVILKAISRTPGCPNVYFRWDTDGNGTWDNCGDLSLANLPGKWYYGSAYDLGCKCLYPNLPSGVQTKLATIQVACGIDGSGNPIGNTYYAQYSVRIDASIPADPNSADDNQLAFIREVAIDDALWFLHTGMTRGGAQGYYNENSPEGIQTTGALALLAFAKHQRFPAYEQYDNYGVTPPPGFTNANSFRWAYDPYSEDAGRLLNYMLAQLVTVSINATDEADDGTTPISGTNNQQGLMINYYSNSELSNKSALLAALSNISMQGTVAQAGGAGILGHTIEYIAQEMVDYAAFSQEKWSDPAKDGGWYYNPNSGKEMSQQSGGWYVALQEAEQKLGVNGVHVPNFVKSHIPNMLHQNQGASGAARYENSLPFEIVESTPTAIYGAEWLGWHNWSTSDYTPAGYPGNTLTRGQCRQIYDNYNAFLSGEWTTANSGYSMLDPTLWKDGNYNSNNLPNAYYLSLMNVRLAAGDNYSSFLGHDLFREFTVNLAKNQSFGSSVNYSYHQYGSFPYPANYVYSMFMNKRFGFSAMALITLTIGPEVALPLDLLHFDAKRMDHRTIKLQWSSLNETNVSHFDIMRSSDGITFELLGKQTASNNPGIHQYVFQDTEAPEIYGYFYRLHMVDLDGAGQYSPLVYIEGEADDNTIRVFPNPAVDWLNIQIHRGAESENQFMLQVLDANGIIVYHSILPLADEYALFGFSLTDWPSGTYFLLVCDTEGRRKQSFMVTILK